MMNMTRATFEDFERKEISGVSYRTGEGLIHIDWVKGNLVRVSCGDQRFFYHALRDAEKMLYSLGIRIPEDEGLF